MGRTDKHETVTNGREIPRDERLPGLSTLLDTEQVGAILAPQVLATVGRVEDCRISYVRYKPGTSCVVMYTLCCTGSGDESLELMFYGKCYTPEAFSNAAQKADSQQWVQMEDVEPVLASPELWSIFYTYPNDCELGGLRTIAHRKKIQRMLYDNLTTYPDDEWRISDKRLRATTVRYKPEKRAVVRFDTRATHRQTRKREPVCVYLRSYSDARGEALFALMQKLHESFHDKGQLEVPRPLAYFPGKYLLLIDGLPGEQMLERISGPRSSECLVATGAAMAALHRFEDSDLEVRSVEDLMEDARSTGETLGHVAPETGEEVEELLALLERSRPEDGEPGFVHGDFYHGQVLVQEEISAILDFDRSYRGDPLADIGNFCAHLRLLVLQGRLRSWVQLQDAFITSYAREATDPDRDRLRFWTALGLFQLSVGPFRSLQPQWRAKTGSILQECRRVLT